MKKIDGCIGQSDGKFEKELTVIADSRKVVLRKLDNGCNRQLDGGIIIPESAEMNNRMAKCVVVSVSDLAVDAYGLMVDDVVLCDRLATYYDTSPICVIDFENIICKMDGDNPLPMKNMIMVVNMKKEESKIGNIIISSDNSVDVPIGLVKESSSDMFDIGDYILLTTGADITEIGGVKYRIYKDDMVFAKIELTDAELVEYKEGE